MQIPALFQQVLSRVRLAAVSGIVAAMVGIAGLAGCGGSNSPAAPAGPAAGLSVASVTFPSMVAGATATAQTVTLTNSGGAVLNITGISITGTNASSFSQTNTCGTTVAVSASCSITVNFLATTAGSYSATLTITNNASSGGSATVPLSGTVTTPTPVASLNATSLTFPSMLAGATATAQSVTVTNTGTGALTISGITFTGTNASNFSQTNNCGTLPATLAVGANCTVTVNFAAASAGSYSATLAIANNSATTPVTVALSGTTTAPPGPTATLNPTSLTFSMVAGATATAQTVTLTNNGGTVLNITGITFTGTNLSNFSQTNNCGTLPATLAVGANCTLSVSFTATSAGSYSATLAIANNSSTNPATVALSGTVTTPQASLSPSTVTFPSMVAGGTSGAQTVTLSNPGGATLNISSIALSGTGANLFSKTTTCGATLAAGANCAINVTLAPLVAGTYTATLTVTDNAAAGTTQTSSLTGTATPFTIAVNTSSACAWTIDNGAITYNWNSKSGNLVSWILDGYTDQLVDTTTTSTPSGCSSQPEGLYFELASTGTFGTTTPTVSCTYVGASVTGTTTCTQGSGTTPYFDWALTYPSSTATGSTSTYTFTDHWLVFPNDPGVHIYTQLSHATTDAAASVGQMQYTFRDSQTTLNHTYEVDAGLGILGVQDITLPAVADTSSTDAARTVQNAAEDLHGFSDIPGVFGRYFDTKYDYAGYEYLHKAHGTYGTGPSGTTYGVWSVFPKQETMVGGPTKQDLWFTGNIVMVEAYSDHEDLPMNLNTAAGVAFNRFFGPFYYHVNTLGKAYNQTGNTLAATADMYNDAVSAGAAFLSANTYDNVAPLVSAGYTPSTGRGTVSIQVNGVTGATHTAWAVLSDPGVNFQVSCNGMQYWADISNNGSATFTGVVPGTYRLSVYVLGQWGEYRQDGIVVTANTTTTLPAVTFQPENFGATVFTIGTPDRSAHEFLHGHFATTTNTHMVMGNDDREYWGNWNYWADFANTSTPGAVVYYATAVGSNAASNYATQWNYNHWGSSFDPGLYDPTNDSTDGYSNTANTYGNGIPIYVSTLTGETGTNGVTTLIPAWQVYFATPANISSYSSGYVDLSISLACTEGSYVVTLNPQGSNLQRIWHYANASDCMIRSGLSGYTQWFVMEWPVSALNQTVGGSNEITVSMSQVDGSSDDAWRLELSNTGANPTNTKWNDYTYVTGTNYPGTGTANSSGLYNNDAVPNP